MGGGAYAVGVSDGDATLNRTPNGGCTLVMLADAVLVALPTWSLGDRTDLVQSDSQPRRAAARPRLAGTLRLRYTTYGRVR